MEQLFFPDIIYRVKEANINYYKTPFVHPRRKMAECDFIYLLEGEWKIAQEGVEYSLKICYNESNVTVFLERRQQYGISGIIY